MPERLLGTDYTNNVWLSTRSRPECEHRRANVERALHLSSTAIAYIRHRRQRRLNPLFRYVAPAMAAMLLIVGTCTSFSCYRHGRLLHLSLDWGSFNITWARTPLVNPQQRFWGRWEFSMHRPRLSFIPRQGWQRESHWATTSGS